MTIMEFLLNHKSSHLRQRKRELFDEITPSCMVPIANGSQEHVWR